MREEAPLRVSRGMGPWGLIFALTAVVLATAGLFHVIVAGLALIGGIAAPTVGETFEAFLASPAHPVAGYTITTVIAPVVYVVWAAVFVGLVAGLAWVWTSRQTKTRAKAEGQTHIADVRSVQQKEAVKQARRVLPDHAAEAELTIPLGKFNNQSVYGQHEDGYLVVAPARSGKTTSLAAGWILDAPGPVLATATKSDIVSLTAHSRAKKGNILVFDPKDVAGLSDQVRWDPVSGCDDLDEAKSRGKALASGGRKTESGGNMGFFEDSAGMVLGYWLHAAAVKDDGSMRDVMRWATDFDDDEPFNLLNTSEEAVLAGWPDRLRGMTRSGSDQTGGSLKMTVLRTLSSLDSPKVMRLICPTADDPVLDVEDFLDSTGTLYVLSETGDASVAPLITMLTDYVVRRAQRISQTKPGGRLWPSLRLVLDEVANIAPLPSLPSIMSDSGGRGITTMVFTQTRAQLQEIWSREGATVIAGNAAAEYYLRGIKEQDLLDELSQRTTKYRAARESISSGSRSGDGSTSVSTEWDQAMHPQDINQLGEGKALLFYRNQKFMIVRLTPFWERSDAAEIQEGVREYAKLTGQEQAS